MSVAWVLLVLASVVAAAIGGRMSALTGAITSSAQAAVTLSLGLVGVLTLWLGLMRVAEEAGLVALLSRMARPVLRRLFPELPADHPAMGAMVMNVAANLLGLGNAATPFGIEAMRRLDDLNSQRGTATDAQALFCALNTASLQLLPATVIGLRAAAGAKNPGNIIGPTLVATASAAIAAVLSAKLLARIFPRPVPVPVPVPGDASASSVAAAGSDSASSPDRTSAPAPIPLSVPGKASSAVVVPGDAGDGRCNRPNDGA